MKKWVKGIILAVASASICACAVMLTGCSGVEDWLKQQKCEHTWNSGIVTEKATCKEEGETTYTCTLCDKTKKEKIAKLPHVEETVEMKAATCTEKGHTDYKKCKVCEEVLVEKKVLPALGHTEIEVKGFDATCTTKGLSDGKMCTRCNEFTVKQVEISALGHTLATLEGKAPTCTETGLTNGIYCKTCSTVYTAQETIKSTGHVVGSNGVCQQCGAFENAEACFAAMANKTAKDVTSTITTLEKGYYRYTFDTSNGVGIWGFGCQFDFDETFSAKYTSVMDGGGGAVFSGFGMNTSDLPCEYGQIALMIMCFQEGVEGPEFLYIRIDNAYEVQFNQAEGYVDFYFYANEWEVYTDDGEFVGTVKLLKDGGTGGFPTGGPNNVTKIEKYV